MRLRCCRSCGRAIALVPEGPRLRRGDLLELDPEPSLDGDVALVRGVGFVLVDGHSFVGRRHRLHACARRRRAA